ncbi:KUP/HAK/KT family potassium transporter [Pararhizobium sp. DWP3-4]|uniref:KUP/HAK/KT family potassium transporter n=1 Tax=Pararhizobium sp. DWP3-4 TaxID=2804565 RepID=UPI003CF7922A
MTADPSQNPIRESVSPSWFRVVFGYIGTSPLYAFREALRPFSHDGISQQEVVGVISLMVWTLTIIVTFKYVLFLMQTSFLGRWTLIGNPNSGLPGWRENLYIAFAGLGVDPSAYFKLPANRVVEIGEQVSI